jgi:TRAP-type C4-dicarboxylate transport system permease small subunit
MAFAEQARQDLPVILDRSTAILNGVAAVSLGVIVIINGINISGRYFFSSPISWAEEAMLYLMVLTIFAGAARVSWEQRHIRIDGIVASMPVPLRWCARFIVLGVMVVVLSIVVTSSWNVISMLYAFDQRSEALEIPLWIPQSIVTIGLTLNGLLILASAILRPEGKSEHPEAALNGEAP